VKFSGSEIILSAFAVLTALLTVINSSFRLDSQWRGYKQAQFNLEHLQSVWDLQILEARQINNSEDGKRFALDATRKLLEDASSIKSGETEGFFENIRLPKVSKK
jgi:hypothetical protein